MYNFSETTGDELSTSMKEVWVNARSQRTVPEDTILIEHPENICWGESRTINKTKLVSQITGYRPRIASYKDEVCMKDYLENIPKSTLLIPKISTFKEYLPESAPLLDFLVAEYMAQRVGSIHFKRNWKIIRNKEVYLMIY